MKKLVVLVVLVLIAPWASCGNSSASSMFWDNPYYYVDGTPIPEADRQEIVTHIYMCDTVDGPCQEFAVVPYGEEMYYGRIYKNKYYKAYVELYGMRSDFNTPTYFGGRGRYK